jgi:hypothetical protein
MTTPSSGWDVQNIILYNQKVKDYKRGMKIKPMREKYSALIGKQIRRYAIPVSRVARYTALAELALRELPLKGMPIWRSKNGEGIFHDEAEIQKRIISFRIAKKIKPKTILESHPGIGVGSALYMRAAPRADLKRLSDSVEDDCNGALIDIDPFGRPWDILLHHRDSLRRASAVQVTSGEIYSVVRNWKRTFQFATRRVGAKAPQWVTTEFIPRVEDITLMKCQFFYAFPTSVRLILSPGRLPESIWNGCERWLWWFSKQGENHE